MIFRRFFESVVTLTRGLQILMLLAIAGAVALLMLAPERPASRHLAAAAIVLAYLCFCALFALPLLRQRRQDRVALPQAAGAQQELLIVVASQTGFADLLARQTLDSLQQVGVSAQSISIERLDAARLQQAKTILFIVSTTGEGDAPDSASVFVRKLMSASLPLAQLRYAVLALGDRGYSQYCAFGHRLQHWLQQQQAQALFDLIEVDRGEQGALRHWQHQLSVFVGHTEMADWSTPAYGNWILQERRLLNPGSAGGPAFHLALRASASDMQWQAGDIAEIGPKHPAQQVESWLSAHGLSGASMVQAGGESISLRQHVARCVLPAVPSMSPVPAMLPATDAENRSAQAWADSLLPLPHREYSIASIPSDGKLELLVRQMQQADGTLGLGSGWLSHYAECGSQIALRIRENRSFHAPPDDRPLILIGNGSGLAGLRAHLKQRAACGHHRNWLVFGERQRQHDYFYREEIMAWQASGVLQKLDLAFSRDQPQAPYVQDQLAAQAEAVRLWVADGAALYVCGSLQGMAAAVTTTLTQILGAAQLDAMTEQGRYRRDVY